MMQNSRFALAAVLVAVAACSSANEEKKADTAESAAMAGCPGSSSGGTTPTSGPDCNAWVFMSDAHSCDAHLGESCGWTASNEGQGYHCQDMGGWIGCEPGGTCTPSSGGSSSSGSAPPPSGGSSSGGSTSGPDCNAWVYMADAHSCDAHVGESCGWTTSNEGQGYHCQHMGGWVGCEPGGTCTPSSGGSSSGGSSSGGSSSSGGAPPPSGGAGSGLASILSEATFDSMFPNRNATYSYQGLVDAASKYGAFATSGGGDGAKREVAAFLANVAHETGGLVYVDEIVKGDYCQSSGSCPCAPGQQYYGRGSLQLSWNFNYCAAGAALGVDLRANPNLISTTPSLAWGTGVWFWMTSTGAGSQTPHDAIVGGSFAGTIRAINGSIECNGGNPGEVADRVQFYQHFCSLLGVSPGSDLSC